MLNSLISFKGHTICDIAKNCAYCGVPISQQYYKIPGATAPTADHMKPRIKRQKKGKVLVAACPQCNKDKANLPLPEFIEKKRPDALLYLERYLSSLKDVKLVLNKKGKDVEFDGEKYCKEVAEEVKDLTGINLNYCI
jgi:hypothetical protein